ncbi:MAG: enoyl-CoA hydratase/isomerase family protein [Reyranellaceae bacterium]
MVSAQQSPVLTRTEGRIGILELNRPDKHNCLSGEVIDRLHQGLDQFEAAPAVSVVLLCAKGNSFSAGADLADVERKRNDPQALRRFLESGIALQRRFETGHLPVVAAVQGLCLAGGLEMMLACDVTFCARSARLGDQHARFGLLPGWGGSQRLPKIVGLRRALDLFLSGRWLDAETAQQWGLVNYVVEDAALLPEAMQYCATLAGYSSEGLAAMKKLARDGYEMSLDRGLRMETDLAVELLRGKAVSEGLSAFVERRKPNFVPAD